ncbi:MAG: DUF6049 family protein [Acidimicrobiales bacterium]
MRFRRPGWSATLALFLVTSASLTPATSAGSDPVGAATPIVELVTQTPTVTRGSTFDMWLRLNGVPEDGSAEVVLHGRVRSRSELAASMEGDGLRGEIYNVTTPIASLPVGPDSTRRLSLSLDPAVVGGVPLTSAGVYPVEIQVRDAAGTPLSTLVTHLVVRPDQADDSPPLGVTVLAKVDAPPALQPDGTIDLDPRALRGASDLVAALAAAPDVPATLAVRPETIDALAASDDPEQTALLDQLRVAATHRSVVALPYVDVSPDALVAANLAQELDRNLEQGRLVLADALGVDPSTATWLAGPDLDLPGLAALKRIGVRHLVVDADRVQPLRRGVLSLSLAQPFLIGSDRPPSVDAITLDPMVLERIDTTASPGLEVSRVLAELAVLWFEQPGVARAVVLPVGGSVRGPVVQGLLTGLSASGLFEAANLDDLFASASPLRQPGGGRVDRSLAPADARPIASALAGGLRSARDRLSSFTGLVGRDSPRAGAVAAQLLVATSSDLDRAERQAHLDSAQSAIDAVVRAVSAPARKTITLTARDGTVPLTLRNDAGLPINVVVHLRSSKLAFPGGATIAKTLTDPTTRLDISVRARASGTFPLEVEVTSPDGLLSLTSVDYSVQSSAVSGVGLVLSVGAAIFLLVWWARHWRRTRRSAKLVAAHPASP